MLHLSIGIQPMVRSDIACSGVMFTLDTESGFRDAVVINGAWGLGEAVVQGMATPDEWIVFKPTLKLGFRPIVTRKLGVKEVKMVFADDGTGTQVRDVVEIAAKSFLSCRFRGSAAWRMGMCDRGPLFEACRQATSRWISNGRRTALPASCSFFRRGPKRSTHRIRQQFHRELRADRRSRCAAGVGCRGRRKDRQRHGACDARSVEAD